MSNTEPPIRAIPVRHLCHDPFVNELFGSRWVVLYLITYLISDFVNKVLVMVDHLKELGRSCPGSLSRVLSIIPVSASHIQNV